MICQRCERVFWDDVWLVFSDSISMRVCSDCADVARELHNSDGYPGNLVVWPLVIQTTWESIPQVTFERKD